MKYLGCLLSTVQEQDIVLSHLAMKAMYREMCLTPSSIQSRTRVVLESPNILQQMGQLVCHTFTPRLLQHQVMQIFESVSRPCNADSDNPHANYNDILGILARQSKVLEALVIMASSAPAANDDNLTANGASNSQELAVLVLLRLAQNVCNRRILAQQVGVLSCLIRYARRLSDLEQQQQQQQQRPNTPDGPIGAATFTATLTGGEVQGRVCLKDLKQRITELAEAM